jgi:hypothetical protein
VSSVLQQDRIYRLKIRGRDHDVPKAKYLGCFRFDWVPEYRGAEPGETLEREWFTYIEGDMIMLSIPPDDILKAKEVT